MKKFIHKYFGRLDRPIALPSKCFRSRQNDYTWENWKADNKARYPFRYWLYETFPAWLRINIKMNIKHLMYWFRAHIYNHYHWLDLRSSVGYKYKWGYIDVDNAMLLACFNLLCRFVEKQGGLEILDYEQASLDQYYINEENEKKAVFLEIKSLYDWWKTGRVKDHKLLNDSYKDKNYRAKPVRITQEDLDKKDDEMLIKLMIYRRYLWT